MLIGKCTENGAGITLQGDSFDFQGLHETIHAIMNEESMVPENISTYCLALAYDARKAMQGSREIVNVMSDEQPLNYFAVNILWPTFIAQVGFLRVYAAFQPTSRAIQANLYLLEDCLYKALESVNINVAQKCMENMYVFGGFYQDYLTNYIDEISEEHVTKNKTLQKRIAQLPDLIEKLIPASPYYRQYVKEVTEIAEEQGCSPFELFRTSELDDVVW